MWRYVTEPKKRKLSLAVASCHLLSLAYTGLQLLVIASPQGVAIHGPGLHGLPRFARNDEEKTRNDEEKTRNDEK